MARVGISRSGHSALGLASATLSILPLVLFGLASALVSYLTRNDPPGADETGYGFGLIVLSLSSVLVEIVALALGVAGTLQWRRKRTFGLAGVACSVLVLA